jgi:hypothetical protein
VSGLTLTSLPRYYVYAVVDLREEPAALRAVFLTRKTARSIVKATEQMEPELKGWLRVRRAKLQTYES